MLSLIKTIKYLVLSLLIVTLMIACNSASNTRVSDGDVTPSVVQPLAADCRIVKHDLGKTELCGQPQKVAVLNAHSLDLLLSLDSQPAGYAAPLNPYRGEVFDNPTQQIPYLGDRIINQPVNLGSDSEPSLEKLALLKPDLIRPVRNINESRKGGRYNLYI